MEVSVNKTESYGKVTTTKLLTTKVKLHFPKQEITVARFLISEEGWIVPGSLNHIFKKLGPVGRVDVQ